MRYYEVMLIFNPLLDPEIIDQQIARFKDILEGLGAKIDKVDKWGMKRLAHRIQRHNEGYYAVLYFYGEKEAATELDRIAGITDEVMRHLTIRRESVPEKEALPVQESLTRDGE